VTDTEHRDPVQVRRAYKFLLRPTSKQVTAIAACLEDNRQLYNAALEERREAWRMGRHSVSFYGQDAQLKDIRAADRDYGRWAFSCERAALRRLDRAFQAFYRRVKAGERPGYPRFKGRGWFDSLEWPQHGRGCKWDSVPHPTVTRVYLLGIGHVRVHQHRAVQGRVKTIAVKREGKRWYIILSCDDVPAQPLPVTGAVVGIDMGVTHFLTTSDGAHVPNPRPLTAAAERLAAAQQELARKKRGSKRRRKAVARIAALHGSVRRTRLDHAHKTALALVRDHDLIAHEALKVANMARRPKPRPVDDGTWEPNGAAAKTGLNQSILDAGWGVFLDVLRAKAESAGRVVVEVNPRNTSRMCAICGHVAEGNRKGEAFRCLSCGHEAHADVNAAVNILRAGLALQANAA
jgi:putative transposase